MHKIHWPDMARLTDSAYWQSHLDLGEIVAFRGLVALHERLSVGEVGTDIFRALMTQGTKAAVHFSA